MALRYNPQEIEKRWQDKWAADKLYEVHEDPSRPEWYDLTMFPYTSGNLHIGHWYAMAPSDVHARFKRMQGFNVLHPMGFDAFGLPAENAAIKHGTHPHKWTMQNVDNMRQQLKQLGAIYDSEREVITSLPEYYKWTQWLFLQLYHAGLAYRAKAPANWCPGCKTVLANEQVLSDGTCERCHTQVTRRDLEQWFFRITKYADELLDHSKIEWPEHINIMQTNWIGRSEGTEIAFGIEEYGLDEKEIWVFTTRPDTVFGVTFMVLAPEHPLVPQLTTPDRRSQVEAYVDAARRQSEIERLSTEKEKTGVFIGAYCVNKLNGVRVPIYIADYALLTYGTGAVMGVPAHDTRDFEYAKKYDLPVKMVIAPEGWSGGELEEAYIEPGTMVNSGSFDGLANEKGKEAVADEMERRGIGRRTVSYRLRDWLISRQRYWGAPIPVVYCRDCGIVPLSEQDLPVLLPEDAEFRPTGESPLTYHEEFVNATCPSCNSPARRETDTMDTFMCSSWYFLRYSTPKHEQGPFDPDKLRYWLPVDQYTGGAEHAVMHLLYARFFVKALRDIGLVEFDEPFLRLFNQGTIIADKQKMSKSRGNVITPDPYVQELGADVVRAYLMFIGPWDQGGEWSDDGINGVVRWLDRVWDLVMLDEGELDRESTDQAAVKQTLHLLHKTIKKANHDLDRFRFNTMLAALMELTNHLFKVWHAKTVDAATWKEAVEDLLLLLAPTAPHLAEELWSRKRYPYSIHNQSFPEWDETLAAEEEITLVVQINGKVRDRLLVPAGIAEDDAKELALGRDKVKAHLDHKSPLKVIYVPGRLVNIVVK